MASSLPQVRSTDPIEDTSFNNVLNNFELETTKYMKKGNLPFHQENTDLGEIRKFVEGQKQDLRDQTVIDNINAVGHVLQTTVNSIEGITSGDPLRVLDGSLAIVGSIVAMVGGPFGAIATSFCGIMGAMLSLSTPTQPDMATVFVELVHSELNKFNQKLQSMQFEGLRMRVANMTERLTSLKKGTTPHLLDQGLYVTSFPQFIGEVSYNIRKGLTKDSKQSDCDDCVYSMVAYCNAQTAFFLLLGNLISHYTKIGANTSDFEILLRTQKQHAMVTLGFLSEEKSYSFVGTLDEGKIFIIIQLRNNINAYNSVEVFRESLGMTRMKDLKFLKQEALMSKLTGPMPRLEDYPQKHAISRCHWFQFINETDFNVRLIMPGVGDHVNNLKFIQQVEPHTSYEHKASGWLLTFSAGGFFVIYLDGQTATDEDPFPEKGHFKVFEFSLSRPFLGLYKTKFIEKTDNLQGVSGLDCWTTMDESSPQPAYWTFKDKYYVVQAGYTEPGKLNASTWWFIVQNYDPDNIEQGCNKQSGQSNVEWPLLNLM